MYMPLNYKKFGTTNITQPKLTIYELEQPSR